MAGAKEMDERAIRLHLEEVSLALLTNEEEHEVLHNLVKGYEGWLRLHGTQNGHAEPGQLALPVSDQGGTIGWRTAVRDAVQKAHGEPIHSKEIFLRAKAAGLRTTAKNPVGIVDLMASRIRGIKKVGPRMWKWVAY